MAQIQAIKGFADLFPAQSRVFQMMEARAREIFPRYGFGELRTPLMEYTDLFCRGIGTETDVVQKEMYCIPDSKGRSMSLRPEATAGVMRAYIESGVHARESVSKFFTIGPMFRHERPQKGRMRQFHQINCECLGPKEPEADAEIICMMMDFLGSLGLHNLTLQINSLGCSSCRPVYRKTLHDWLARLDPALLCEDCKRRMETNPLRVLDCKVPACKEATAGAPVLLDNECPECREHFAAVLRHLDAEHVPYEINHRLVRGLDYYTRTTWEVVSNDIGAQGSVAGGGRYDGLVAQLGGPAVPGIGFACGMERLALLLEGRPQPESRPDFFMAVLDPSCRDAAFGLTQKLRHEGFSGIMGYESRSMKATMRQAGKSNARCALIMGTNELAAGTVIIKHMESGEQEEAPLAEVSARLTAE
ncbi:histidine--tRNA ligase [uncultured Mailhella sp.]|uniref:histidine--tRNA ligase n=1 Tax=uncultured Mailhella sp. TaxID=1981031 RepID=UPI00260B3E74|nr:histidine--tRNA ligase [uncultured Mailhella sp.]